MFLEAKLAMKKELASFIRDSATCTHICVCARACLRACMCVCVWKYIYISEGVPCHLDLMP